MINIDQFLLGKPLKFLETPIPFLYTCHTFSMDKNPTVLSMFPIESSVNVGLPESQV
jgi:hypothetical protein